MKKNQLLTFCGILISLFLLSSCEEKEEEEQEGKKAYVDLGLPSGTLWATCNVGATSPEDYGDYFAWGETEPYDENGKTYYEWSTYKWCNGNYIKLSKYCNKSDCGMFGFTDTLTELEPEDDAACAKWGTDWRMPSLAQIKELINSSYTTSEWITLHGVNGLKVTSISNGNSIFLPAAGYRIGSSLYDAGSNCSYWSCSLYSDNPLCAYSLDVVSSRVSTDDDDRGVGFSVRSVRLKE